jgi:hypothetical protein
MTLLRMRVVHGIGDLDREVERSLELDRALAHDDRLERVSPAMYSITMKKTPSCFSAVRP